VPLPKKAPSIHATYENQRVVQQILDTLNALDLDDLDKASLDALEADLKALKERKLVQVVVAGAAKETNIAVAGIKKGKDSIVSVVRFDLAAEGKLEDVGGLTADASITSDGNIQLKETVTTGDKLLVTYYDADGNA
jgi:hypothetical protein